MKVPRNLSCSKLTKIYQGILPCLKDTSNQMRMNINLRSLNGISIMEMTRKRRVKLMNSCWFNLCQLNQCGSKNLFYLLNSFRLRLSLNLQSKLINNNKNTASLGTRHLSQMLKQNNQFKYQSLLLLLFQNQFSQLQKALNL